MADYLDHTHIAQKLLDQQGEINDLTAKFGFLRRVLEIFSISHADSTDDLWWRVDDGKIRLFVNVSDVFFWGAADLEDITPERLPTLEQAYTDAKAAGCEGFTAELYAARIRGERPQGAAYPPYPRDADRRPKWQAVKDLYDACGPKREIGLGNPRRPPTEPVASPPADPTGDPT